MNTTNNEQQNQEPNDKSTPTPTPPDTNTPPAKYDQNIADAIVPIDKVCYESADGLVRIEQLVVGAAKFPPSPYPCIVLAAKPVKSARVRNIDGGYVEVMPTFREMEALVDAMNEAALASGKGKLYEVLQRVPEKSEARKRKWRAFNEARLAKKRKPGNRWRGKKKHKQGNH